MKKILLLFTTALLSVPALCQSTWNADPMHSRLAFSVTHLGISDIDGVFKTFEASATGKKDDFSDAVFTLSADVASIDTQVGMRDDHLRSADFFNVEKHPKMIFKSTSIKSVGKNKYKLTGNLTMHGVTKPVVLDAWYRGTTTNPQSKATTAGFQITGALKRSDFNIGPNFPEAMISDTVNIKADAEFIKK